MKTLALINEVKDVKDILTNAIKLLKDETLEVLFVHEEELFDLPDLFKPDFEKDDTIDKDAIKKEILKQLNELKFNKDVAIFVKISDTASQASALLKEQKAIIVTKLNDATINLQDSKYTIFYASSQETYKNIAINIKLDSDTQECIDFAKENFKDAKITLVYDYINYIDITAVGVDPLLAPEFDPTINAEVVEAQKNIFKDFIKKAGFNGVFLEDFSQESALSEYVNDNGVDLLISCERDIDIKKINSAIVLK